MTANALHMNMLLGYIDIILTYINSINVIK